MTPDFPDFDESQVPEDAVVGVDSVDVGDYSDYRAGFVAIVGRPNVGKSTLTNVLVGTKVAITSDRPETTRHSVRGIIQRDKAQVVLVDTPGYHKPRTVLGQRLNDDVHDALADVDAVIFAVPADQKIGPGDRFIASNLRDIKAPVIAVVTKTDTVDKDTVIERLAEVAQLSQSDDSVTFDDIVAVSARAGQRVQTLIDVLVSHMPPGPPLYPIDMLSDEPVNVMIAELIREAALSSLHEELPHSLAVQVEEIILTGSDGQAVDAALLIGPGGGATVGSGDLKRDGSGEGDDLDTRADEAGDLQRDGSGEAGDLDTPADESGDLDTPAEKPPVDIHVNIYVERPSQKGIIIGKRGAGIRNIRLKSQGKIKKLLGRKVHLKLHVRVAKNWQSDPKMLGRLGF